MSSHPATSPPRPTPTRLPMTLPRLAEKKRLGEPIVMVTAYDYPSARAAEAAGVDLVLVGDSGAMTVLGYHVDRRRSTLDEHAHARARRAPRPAHAAAGRRPAVRLLRGLRRAGDHDRAALRQGGRLRRRQARGRRRDVGRARPGDRQRRHPGDGPRRPDAADVDRARRLPRAGPHAPTRRRAIAARGARAAGGRLLLDRLRGDPERRRRGAHAADGDPGDRHRRRPGDRRPGARLPRPARHPRGARRRASSSATPTSRTRWSPASRAYAEDVRTRALPGARARLLDPGRGARGASRAASPSAASARAPAHRRPARPRRAAAPARPRR